VDTELNPLQQAVIDALGVPPDWEPLPAEIVASIEAQLTEALAPIKDLFTPEDPLRINKHHIATVHGCEKYHVLNRQSQFAWNINTVRGTMAHKAIELLINWRGPVIPSEIVDAAITSVAENPRESASDFIISLPAHELAELRGAVVGAVSNFLECFHPYVRSGVHLSNTQRHIRYSVALFSSHLEWTSYLAIQGARSSSTSRPADSLLLTATTFVSMHSSKHCAAGSRPAVWVRIHSTLHASMKKMSLKDSCNLQCVAQPTELCLLQILF
jgi:hypothetical protein